MSAKILARNTWTNEPAVGSRLSLPVRELWVHHAVTETTKGKSRRQVAALLQRIRAFHVSERGYSDIGYSFAIDANGRIWRLRGLRVGAHTLGRNDNSIGVVLLGNFETERPTAEMIASIYDLRDHLRERGALTKRSKLDGHRNAPGAATACPGRHVMERI